MWLLAKIYALLLIFLSFTTAAFFHTASETFAAWLLACLLRRALTSLTNAQQPDHSSISRGKAVASEGALQTLTWAAVLPFWLVCTAAAFEDARRARRGPSRSELPLLTAMAVYDSVLWLLLAALARGACAHPSGGGQAPRDEARALHHRDEARSNASGSSDDGSGSG